MYIFDLKVPSSININHIYRVKQKTAVTAFLLHKVSTVFSLISNIFKTV